MGKPTIACLGILLTLAMHSHTQQLFIPIMPLPMAGYVYQTPVRSFELPIAPRNPALEPTASIVPSPFAPAFPPRTAICVLRTAKGSQSEISGGVFVTQETERGPIVVSGTIQGLSPGKHGFHLHQDPIEGNDCNAAGSHFNPFNKTHGGPNDENRHAGDFGNIEASEQGVAFVSIQIPGDMIAVEAGGALGIIGRSIVIHEKEDDLGRGRAADSLKTGAAGGRQACCMLTNLPSQPV